MKQMYSKNKPRWMQFHHFQLEIAFKSPEMHFKNGIWPTVEICISPISPDLKCGIK